MGGTDVVDRGVRGDFDKLTACFEATVVIAAINDWL